LRIGRESTRFYTNARFDIRSSCEFVRDRFTGEHRTNADEESE
jgi:hypothetical protein